MKGRSYGLPFPSDVPGDADDVTGRRAAVYSKREKKECHNRKVWRAEVVAPGGNENRLRESYFRAASRASVAFASRVSHDGSAPPASFSSTARASGVPTRSSTSSARSLCSSSAL